MITGRLQMLFAAAVVAIGSGSIPVLPSTGEDTRNIYVRHDISDTAGELECLVCTAYWDEINDPDLYTSWIHGFELNSGELCDTPVERAMNEDCASCGGASECHDTARVGWCHVQCADTFAMKPDELLMAVEENDITSLFDAMTSSAIVLNIERRLLQPLLSCGMVQANIPIPAKLVAQLQERFELYENQGLWLGVQLK